MDQHFSVATFNHHRQNAEHNALFIAAGQILGHSWGRIMQALAFIVRLSSGEVIGPQLSLVSLKNLIIN